MATNDEHPEGSMQAEPQEEHRWLEKLVGEWEIEGETDMGPDKPAEKTAGTESVRSLGGLWFVAEGSSDMPGGGKGTWVMTLGYDPRKKRYVGNWVGSMMTNQWVYEGELDEDERVLTLETEGPAMDGEGKLTKYKDVIEFKDDDHRVLTSHAQGEDGKWGQLVEVRYRRKK